MINTAVTNGIKVSVAVKYEGYAQAEEKYVFSYTILIENNSSETVQLLRRHWFIIDSLGENREVEGAGVIGEQPILKPGQIHEYSSWCPLESEMGMMRGKFLMERASDQELLDIRVPHFQMTVPYLSN